MIWTVSGNLNIALFWPSSTCRFAVQRETSRHWWRMFSKWHELKGVDSVALFIVFASTRWNCLDFTINEMICIKRDIQKFYLNKKNIRCFNRNFKKTSEAKLRWWLNLCYVKGLKWWKPCSFWHDSGPTCKIWTPPCTMKQNIKLAIRNLHNFFELLILPKWVMVLQQQNCNYVFSTVVTPQIFTKDSKGLKNLKILQAKSFHDMLLKL